MWNGDYKFVIGNLVEKDFKIRYRNMSLGVFWSMLNPLVLMGVLTFIFTKIAPVNNMDHYALQVLCGLVPFSFFSVAWVGATTSLVDNAVLIKRVPVPREIIPVASVLSNCLHLFIQIFLLLAMTLIFRRGVNVYWFWLPVVWGLEVVFVCGLGLMFAALNVYIRDMRYVVESATTVLFWLVPIFYSFTIIPHQYLDLYLYNPIAAMVICLRNILVDGRPPAHSTLIKLTLSSFTVLSCGILVFEKLKRRFYEFL
ncbi:MAG: ABC transporter permease [Bryobacteraceae bacterium]